jgi:hypothetical protein
MVKGKIRGTKKKKEQEYDGFVNRERSWIENHRTTIWQISLVLLGCILGLGGSILWTDYQNYQNDSSVARGLYNELNASNNPVKIWAPIFIEGVPTEPVINNSFFLNTSLFPSITDNDQRFDKKLKQNITYYYTNLSDAEDYRLKLEEVQKINSGQNTTNSSYGQYNVFLEKDYIDAMKSKLLYCYKQIPIIKTQIKEYFRI